MKHLLIGAIAGALLCTPALAQQQRGNANNNGGAQGGAILQLPPSVQNVVSIDAFNLLIIASDGERRGETRYTPTLIKHVYSGGIARLFGGTSVPTAQFATPGQFGNNGGNGNGNTNGGVAAVGGAQNGFGGNTNNGGFGATQNGFGGIQGNRGGTFQNGVLGGRGFNTLNRNDVVNARVRAR